MVSLPAQVSFDLNRQLLIYQHQYCAEPKYWTN
jgi:hypothetical protein